MTAPIIYHGTRNEMTRAAFYVPLPRYGDNERTTAENGQLWQRVAEGKRRDWPKQ